MSFLFNDIFGGGMPGGHHHHHHHHGPGDDDSDPEETDTEKFYQLLDIEKSATADDIKKAYRKKARILHPDRHSEEREKYQAMFQEVQRAHEVLKDPQKRALYDKYGEKGVKRGGGAASRSGSSLLEQMFGGGRGGGGGNEASARKSPSIKAALEVTLEDIYCGATKKLKIQRRVATDSSATCPRCKGQGQITEIQRMGPMVLQQRRECPQCAGIGYKLQNKVAEIEVHIPVGGKHGESVTIQGQGHQYPDMEPGDVVLQLRQQKHSLFERKGADLGMNYTLSLRQALCGYKIKIPHVCRKMLVVTTSLDRHEVVQPGSLQVVHTQGLPQRYAAHVKGHLYIVMEVELPLSKSLPMSAIRQFEKLLPDAGVEENDEDDNEDDEDQEMDGGGDNEEKKQAPTQQTGNSNNKKKAQKAKPKNKQFKNNRRTKSKKNLKKKNSKKNSGVFGGLQGHFAGSAGNADKQDIIDSDDEDDEMTEHVEAFSVDGNPKATPATASNYQDDDEEDGEGVQCRQM